MSEPKTYTSTFGFVWFINPEHLKYLPRDGQVHVVNESGKILDACDLPALAKSLSMFPVPEYSGTYTDGEIKISQLGRPRFHATCPARDHSAWEIQALNIEGKWIETLLHKTKTARAARDKQALEDAKRRRANAYEAFGIMKDGEPIPPTDEDEEKRIIAVYKSERRSE